MTLVLSSMVNMHGQEQNSILINLFGKCKIILWIGKLMLQSVIYRLTYLRKMYIRSSFENLFNESCLSMLSANNIAFSVFICFLQLICIRV